MKILKIDRLFKSPLFLLFFGISYTMSAENKLSANFTDDLAKDGFIGYYIVGGILAFGIIGYLIVSLIRKQENSRSSNYTRHKHFHHRHYHNHRLSKKSA
jgi:hypothetical protein